MKRLIYLSLLMLVLGACDKEKRLAQRTSGVYEVYKYELGYYTNGSLDSTMTVEDFGTFALLNNGSDLYNQTELVYNSTTTPVFWDPAHYGFINAVRWYLDYEEDKTITFWCDLDISTTFVTYSRENRKGKKEEWVAVITDSNGNITEKETFFVKKQ